MSSATRSGRGTPEAERSRRTKSKRPTAQSLASWAQYGLVRVEKAEFCVDRLEALCRLDGFLQGSGLRLLCGNVGIGGGGSCSGHLSEVRGGRRWGGVQGSGSVVHRRFAGGAEGSEATG
jgi:hypothetical protein